jgi:serine/threonine-protein kinase
MSSSPDAAAAARPKPEESLVGRRVHKYEIVRSIGRGGMGTVYEALNTSIGKRVAMKFIDAELAQNKDTIARFHREAQAASAVESAHIVEIFDSGFTEEDAPFIVMELLRGEDLGHRIKRCGKLELNEALHVTAQILRGLHRAHEAGIVHRDLKPDNIFLVDRDDDPNFVKILDFGISKVQRGGEVPAHTLTRQGTVLGTPFYMSPEQAQALPDLDSRTDLWSVGAILYECLTGHPPHTGNTYEQVIVSICMKDVEDVRNENPSVPEPIARVIAKALTRERTDRFSSARDFLDALVASAPGLISSRLGSSSGEEGGTSTPPGAAGRTPLSLTPKGAGDPASAFGPTLEVRSGSKVGWSTSSGAGGLRPQRRVIAAIAAVSLFAGVAGAVMYARRTPASDPSAPLEPAEITLQLRANVQSARFLVDGVALPGGMLKGRGGETKRIRVEADGYTPIDKEVLLQPGDGPVEVALEPLPPIVTPALPPPNATATSSAATTPAGDMARPVKGPSSPGSRPISKAGQPATPPPEPTGIGGGLKLKTD